MQRIIGWILILVNAVLKKKRVKFSVKSVGATIVGLAHIEMKRPDEDCFGELEVGETKAFFVVDGAGGEENGRKASITVFRKLNQILPGFMESWTCRQDMERDMLKIRQHANEAARAANGKATLILYVLLPNGSWALLQVGDAIFVGKKKDGTWVLPIKPMKFGYPGTCKRNLTELLGTDSMYMACASGDEPFECFFLMSDWACGNKANSLIQDTTPEAIFGDYSVNQKALNALVTEIFVSGVVLNSLEMQNLLERIQRGEIPLIEASNDDMTVIYGVLC